MWLRVNSRKGQNDSCEVNRRSMLSRPLSIVESDEPECVSMPNYGLFLGWFWCKCDNLTSVS